ncbi:MAG: hypothetical protein KIT84_08975 [Labilithrix sp.]|nr:hypothetical protein [Labilithrix sp.]MCW5811132.1 hypothetical protein [Labilithrix sp.]
MKRVLGALAIAVVVACGAAPEGDASDTSGMTTGPAAIHPGWFKTPEAIVETMTRTWELTLTADEESRYVGGLRASLGGVSVAQQGSPIDRPHELFALALQSLATFTAEKLVAKQIAKTAAGEPYVFDGLGLSGEDDGCYADDSQDWCDAADGIFVGELTARGFDPTAPSRSDRKRLMHKMQSIGEFFLMAIDDRTTMPDGDRHAPAFLVDEVLLPKLREAPLSVEQEKQAWQEVITTILLGGYYFDLPATE